MSSEQRGLTDDDYERIREAAEQGKRNMAYVLSDNPGKAGRAKEPMTPRECALIRCMRALRMPSHDIVDGVDLPHAKQTIRHHGRGDCGHNAEVPVPPTVIRTADGEITRDDERTRERRKEWRDERGESK